LVKAYSFIRIGLECIISQAIKHSERFLQLQHNTSPYANLPDTERTILNDINAFIDSGDYKSVRRKAEELGIVIQTGYVAYKNSEKINKWSVPLAITGLIFTIIFGILSMIK